MIGELTLDSFAPHHGTTFRLFPTDGQAFDVELAEARSIGRSPSPGMRDPFSLVFRSASKGHVPQRIYRLEHPVMGRLDLFLVPIGPDESGMRYEAIFA